MSAPLKKSLIIFGISVVVLTAVFCCVPIEMFDGEKVFEVNGQEIVVKEKLSLSHFFGIGLEEANLDLAKSFRLTGMGWILVFIFIIGIPGLISYRFYLKWTTPKEEN